MPLLTLTGFMQQTNRSVDSVEDTSLAFIY